MYCCVLNAYFANFVALLAQDKLLIIYYRMCIKEILFYNQVLNYFKEYSVIINRNLKDAYRILQRMIILL